MVNKRGPYAGQLKETAAWKIEATLAQDLHQTDENTIKQRSQKLHRHPAFRIGLLACIAAIPLLAQGPFAATVTSLQTFALFFARAFAVIAVIIGGAVATVGGHRAEGIMAIILGVGMMAEAANIVAWLFP